MIRPKLVSVALGIAIGILMAGAGAAGSQNGRGNIIRFDLAQIVQGTVLCCGTNIAKAESGDMLTLTGSGEARTGAHPSAAGGGTFVHERPHGHGTVVVARGIWVVTGFVSWTDGGGTLPVADGIGRASDARAGLLTVDVEFQPEGGGALSGVMTIHCVLPNNTLPPGEEEGTSVEVAGLDFEQAGGVTLFHVLS